MKPRLKLDLQLFAEDGGTETQTESTPTFEEMYHNGAPEETEPAGGADDLSDSDNPELPEEINTDPTDAGGAPQPWKTKQNAQFAAERRRQEEQARIAQAVQAEKDRFYAEQYAGQVNPYTNQPIQTEADFRAYQEAYAAEMRQQAGINDAQWDQMIQNTPAVQQAQQIIAQQQMMQAQAQQMQEQQKLNKAVEAIRKFDKSVKGEQDIINNPHFEEIKVMYQRGYSLEDAYYLANRAELEQKRSAAARQQAVNQVVGRQHMQATGQNGTGDEIVVPPDQLAMYRRFLPNATESEIKKHWAKCQKKG